MTDATKPTPESQAQPGVRLDHPTFKVVKEAFPGKRFRGTEFRGQSTLLVDPADLHEVMAFLKSDDRCRYCFLSDVAGVDYLNYPAPMAGRFGIIYNLISFDHDQRFFVKTFVNPSMPTDGNAKDPALEVESVCDLWPGAEWLEREVYDMFGIRFRNHPDMRRILLWEDYPGHPLRKDYPVRGRGERESYRVIDRTSA